MFLNKNKFCVNELLVMWFLSEIPSIIVLLEIYFLWRRKRRGRVKP